MSLDKTMIIHTTDYDSITGSISSNAEQTKLEEISSMPKKWCDGTEITQALDKDTTHLYKLMDKHHKHTAEVLPPALTKIKDSIVKTDEIISETVGLEGLQ